MAWNSLENRSSASRFGTAPSRSEAGVRVAEARGNVFVTLDWRPTPDWAVGAGAAYEMSSIRADEGRPTHFGFLKPRLTVSYKPDDRSNLRVSVRRSVGQLSLGDFAASTDPAQGKAYGGNTGLRPDHRVTAVLDYDRRFKERGAVTLSVFHDWRRDTLEAAVLPSGAFGMANVDRTRVWGASANLELPLDDLAPGGLVRLGYVYRGSRLVDPVTGQRRGVTGQQPQALTVAFRQDVNAAGLSWGFDYARGFRAWHWYADEARDHRRAETLSVYVEAHRLAGVKVRFQLDGLTGTRNTYDRLQFATSRAGTASLREIWDIRTPLAASIAISRSF